MDAQNCVNRIYAWDTLKGLCIICVLAGHLLCEMPFVLLDFVLLFWIYSWHVPLFMLISGRFAKFNWKRACCFLVLFAIFRSWFIGSLGLYLFSIPLLDRIATKKRQCLVTAISVVVGVLLGFCSLPPSLWVINKSITCLPYFLFGKYRLFENFRIKHKISSFILLCFITFALMPWFQSKLPFLMNGPYVSVTWLQRFAAYAISFAWLIWWTQSITQKKIPFITTLGKITCGIYVFHDPFVAFVSQLILPLTTFTPFSSIIVFIVTILWICILWYPALWLNKLIQWVSHFGGTQNAITS